MQNLILHIVRMRRKAFIRIHLHLLAQKRKIEMTLCDYPANDSEGFRKKAKPRVVPWSIVYLSIHFS